MEIKGFKNTNIYFENQGIVKSGFAVKDKKIAPLTGGEEGLLELDDKYLVIPGFIDKHIHGSNHSDAMYPTFEDILNIAKSIAQEGVTAFLPTTMTQSGERRRRPGQHQEVYRAKRRRRGTKGRPSRRSSSSAKYKGSQHEQFISPAISNQ